MGSSGFTSRNKSHKSTGGGRELQGGEELKEVTGAAEIQRCVLTR